ncbi:hypothetical protein BDV95DRAFT_487963 [Massariosphaeria phaeospora]|uniref:Xylanolytic transcriptional activator regulatory domain-containing protein n=1 Tax=Massariosphaeria phaeospora TaxID=100035 RepID=A0A7C8MCR9_9PLEO|nr:hypothetical protein BDV95DRAFT_487963 [Massariosphaeria phaeospora]
MDSNTTTKNENSKKRPSKGLRACWECKKRKIYQNDSSNNTTSGLNSVSTENVDDDSCACHIGDRLGKLEQLFEKFVCRKLPLFAGPATDAQSTTVVDPDEKGSKADDFGLPEIANDTQSIASIGEGILAAQHSTWTSAPSIRTLVERRESAPISNCETVRRSLVALLPSQHDANVIFESSNGWTILNGVYKPSKNLFVNEDVGSYALNMTAVAKEPLITIARTLLHFAVCISSLPPEFDTSRLEQMWSLDAAMQNYVSTVSSLVTSSDEQMLTLPGLETLMLLALYHMNNANLRQAWLVNRRALNLAHLMGLHRILEQAETTPPIEAVESAKFIWRSFVDLDRYIGLHLRLPFASNDYPCPKNADSYLAHRCKLASICRQIGELDREVTPQAYVQALAIDEKLEAMMKEQSKEFWDVPNVPSTARTPESAAVLERLIVQIWHFEMKVFIHLPYLLRASRESRYEYAKITALQASRNIVMRWFALRNAGITQACCRFGEIAVFMATVTLALDILIEMGMKEPGEVKKTKSNDFAMVCRVISEMEKLAKSSSREQIAARSAIVIKKILSSLDPSTRNAGKSRLTIPYFGTIEVNWCKLPMRPPFDLDSDTGKKMNTTATGGHVPVFSFVKNALWPATEGTWGADLDFDIVLFDGLEDKDTDGNWMF